MVIKIGGAAFDGAEGFHALAKSQQKLKDAEFIIVHGGGKEISQALKAANRETVFIDGIRMTTKADLEIVEKVLSETINSRIASYMLENGVKCQRMSGCTNNMFVVEPLKRNGRDLGYVGKIKMVNAQPVFESLRAGQLPVISPISVDDAGNKYNVNADSAAAAIAVGAKCTDLVYFSDVPGVQVNGNVLPDLDMEKALELIKAGIIKDGMVAKMESAFEALRGNVQRVLFTQWQGDDTLKNIIEKKLAVGTTIYL